MSKQTRSGAEPAQEKRLDKFTRDWDTEIWKKGYFSGEKLTLPDLRLLLEHFEPLQDLIREIAAPGPQASPTVHDEDDAAPCAEPPAPEVLARMEAELAQEKSQNLRLRTECANVLTSLNDCKATVEALQKDKKAQKKNIDDLKKEREQLKAQLQQTENALASAQASTRPPPALDLLRDDPELAQAIGLAGLPDDDTQALIQTVAILSQLDNLQRLWDALKERCETGNRPASAAERALLEFALTWHNHNWLTLPYRLTEAIPSSAYDYSRHLPSRHTPKGETVAALHLPGIADGSGKPLRKALVRKH